jgi:mycothiol S-conjugate amidase
VLVTYNDDHRGYPHPDHVRVHEISVLAFERAGDHAWYPEAGEPWQPAKLYYSAWSRMRIVAMHEAMLRLRGESPFDEGWFTRDDIDGRITTRTPVAEWLWARSGSLRAHRTQIDETSPFWFGLSDEELAEAYPWEDWILAGSNVPLDLVAEGCYEEDMFRGIGGGS